VLIRWHRQESFPAFAPLQKAGRSANPRLPRANWGNDGIPRARGFSVASRALRLTIRLVIAAHQLRQKVRTFLRRQRLDGQFAYRGGSPRSPHSVIYSRSRFGCVFPSSVSSRLPHRRNLEIQGSAGGPTTRPRTRLAKVLGTQNSSSASVRQRSSGLIALSRRSQRGLPERQQPQPTILAAMSRTSWSSSSGAARTPRHRIRA